MKFAIEEKTQNEQEAEQLVRNPDNIDMVEKGLDLVPQTRLSEPLYQNAMTRVVGQATTDAMVAEAEAETLQKRYSDELAGIMRGADDKTLQKISSGIIDIPMPVPDFSRRGLSNIQPNGIVQNTLQGRGVHGLTPVSAQNMQRQMIEDMAPKPKKMAKEELEKRERERALKKQQEAEAEAKTKNSEAMTLLLIGAAALAYDNAPAPVVGGGKPQNKAQEATPLPPKAQQPNHPNLKLVGLAAAAAVVGPSVPVLAATVASESPAAVLGSGKAA